MRELLSGYSDTLRNLNLSRTVAGITKWFWVTIEGYLSYLLPKLEDFVPTSLGSGAISTRQKCVTVTADYCRLTYKYVLSAAVTSKPDEPCRCEITYAEDSNGRWFSESCLARAQQVSSIEMGKYDYQSRASEASEALVAWNGDNLATHLLN